MEVRRVKKEWGEEIWLANTPLYCGKKLILNKGKRVSLHKHKNKDETFYIDEGKLLMEVGEKKWIMKKGDVVRIPPNVLHRFTGIDNAVIIEISTHHDDADSYREEGQLSGDVPKEIMEEYF
ncbi:MAG: cupin domain-containing protein [Nanoarchaeota archaeon]|nr:cupin domain-containing protein [Nanoarchaeota archaeon]